MVKMPGQAAQSATLMAEILASVPELPAGTVNIVIESGSEVAKLLVESPQVPVISFTGSTATGSLIARAGAAHFKRVGLELGGKTPHLVFADADADLDLAVPTAVASSTVFAGQFCMTGSRILVQREIADEFTEKLAQRLKAVTPGPVSDPASEIDPLIDKASIARVDAAVEAAIAAGAKAIVRGGPATDPALADGAFYHPTLLSVSDSSRCRSCRRRPSGRCRPCRSSTPRTRPSHWPTTRSTGSAPVSGARTSTGRYGDGLVNDLLREALGPGDGVLVASKVGTTPDPGGPFPMRAAQRPEELLADVEDNLRSLGLDRLPPVNLRRLDGSSRLRAEGDQVVDIDDQLGAMTGLRDEGKIGAIGLSSVTLDGLRRALPAGIACVQNEYSLVNRDDEDMLALCVAEQIAWVPFFPLGGAFPGARKVTDEPAARAVARSLDAEPAEVGLAWLLHHRPNVLLIPGTADVGHLEANVAAGAITLDEDTLADLDSAAQHLA